MSASLLFEAEPQCPVVGTDRALSVYSSVSGHWACFLLSAIVGDADVNTGVQVSSWSPAFNFYDVRIPRGGTAGQYDNSI